MSDFIPFNSVSQKLISKKDRKRISRHIMSLLRSNGLHAEGLITIGPFEQSEFLDTYDETLPISKEVFDRAYSKFKEELNTLLTSESKNIQLPLRAKCSLTFHTSGHASRKPVISWEANYG